MITDLVQIKQLGEKKQVENEKFRRYLKRHNFPELKFRRVAEDIESAIDCRACANCCKVAETDVTERDIARLSRYLGMSPQRVRRAIHDGIGVRAEGADPAAPRDRLHFPRWQRLHDLRSPARYLPRLPASDPGRGFVRKPHVADGGPGHLLPDRL